MPYRKDPETKEALIDRLLMADYDGDIRRVGAQPAHLKRIAPHMLRLEFPDTGAIFDLTVHRPRKPEKALARVRADENRSFAGANEDWTVDPVEQPQRRRKRRQSPARPAASR